MRIGSNHLSLSDENHVLHTVRCNISGDAAGEIWILITLGSGRVKSPGLPETLQECVFLHFRSLNCPQIGQKNSVVFAISFWFLSDWLRAFEIRAEWLGLASGTRNSFVISLGVRCLPPWLARRAAAGLSKSAAVMSRPDSLLRLCCQQNAGNEVTDG